MTSYRFAYPEEIQRSLHSKKEKFINSTKRACEEAITAIKSVEEKEIKELGKL